MEELRTTQVITIGAISAALCTACLYVASQALTFRLALIFIASLCTIPLAFEGKTGASVISYLAGGLLSLLICPQKFPAAAYLLLFGSYAIFKIWIDRRVFRKSLLYGIKCAVFCTLLGIGVLIAFQLSILPAKIVSFLQMPKVLLLLPCGIVLCIILDAAYASAFSIYQTRLRSQIFSKR